MHTHLLTYLRSHSRSALVFRNTVPNTRTYIHTHGTCFSRSCFPSITHAHRTYIHHITHPHDSRDCCRCYYSLEAGLFEVLLHQVTQQPTAAAPPPPKAVLSPRSLVFPPLILDSSFFPSASPSFLRFSQRKKQCCIPPTPVNIPLSFFFRLYTYFLSFFLFQRASSFLPVHIPHTRYQALR